ncbi:uncharacterized protein LOC126824934 [Patella vulgata]|uniref:uncharacterized protein LOC126824934 n=1 Tax=Patella vulgata TaxID=6465 RepID=UPI0024A9322C|nr:uncharacterized protein LOC126824934 [Patella vulgata]
MASSITILLLVAILVVIDVDTSGAKRFKYTDSSLKEGRVVDVKIPDPDFHSSDQVTPDEKLTRLRRHIFGGNWRRGHRQKATPYGRTRKRLVHSRRIPGSDGKEKSFSWFHRWPGSDGKDKRFSWYHHWTSGDGNTHRRFSIHTNIFNRDRQPVKPTHETTSLKPDHVRHPDKPAYQRWPHKPDADREQDKPGHSSQLHKPWSIFKPIRHRYPPPRPSRDWSSWWTRPTNPLSHFIQSAINAFGGRKSWYQTTKEFVYEYAPFIPLVYKQDKYTFVKPIGRPMPQVYVLHKLRISCIKYPSLCDEAMKNITKNDQEPEKPSEKPGQWPEIIGKPQRPTEKPMKIPEDPATTVQITDAGMTTTLLSSTADYTTTTMTLGTTSNYPLTTTTSGTTSNYPMTTTTLATTSKPVPTEKEVFLPPEGSGEVGPELFIPPEVAAE